MFRVQEAVISHFVYKQNEIFLNSYNRLHVTYEVRYKDIIGDMIGDIVDTVNGFEEYSGVIVCKSNERCIVLEEALKRYKVDCTVLHSNLSDEDKNNVIQSFLKDETTVLITIGMYTKLLEVHMI